MSSFQDLDVFFVYNNPETEAQKSYAHAALNYKTDRESLPFYAAWAFLLWDSTSGLL